MSDRDELYVIHILECIDKINRFTQRDHDRFLSEEIVQDAVLRNLQTLAESVKRLSDDLKSPLPDIRWQSIVGFRNLIVHDYLGVNVERVWEILEHDLPQLETALRPLAPEITDDQGAGVKDANGKDADENAGGGTRTPTS